MARRGGRVPVAFTSPAWDVSAIGDLAGRIAVVTGCTSGIGMEAARVLASKNARVVMAVRNKDKGLKVARDIRREVGKEAVIDVRTLDLASLKSISEFAEDFGAREDRLDLLLNNAGVMMCPYSKTDDGFEMQMGTNHLGHFALTGHLMPLLRNTNSSRVVSVASGAHYAGNIDLDDLDWSSRKYNTWKAYADSKLANLCFTNELARRVDAEQHTGPLIAAAHPGYTNSDLFRHTGPGQLFSAAVGQSCAMGALPMLRAACDDNTTQGQYYGPSFAEIRGPPVEVKSSPMSKDSELGRRLWEQSVELTGVEY